MAYTSVNIANMALSHLGKTGIVSLSENSVEARECTQWYDPAARLAKRRSLWTFDRSILALTPMFNDYSERWAFKYDRPSSAAKIIRIIPETDPVGETSNKPVPYQLLGPALYCNYDGAKADIINTGTTPTQWPDDFALAVSYALAKFMAAKLTRKASYTSDMATLYEDALGRAIEADASQTPHYYAYENQYLSDRGAGGEAAEGKSVDGSIYWG